MNLLLFISIYKDSNSIKLPEQPMSALRQYHILSAAEHYSAHIGPRQALATHIAMQSLSGEMPLW